jgi:hypothetical protein
MHIERETYPGYGGSLTLAYSARADAAVVSLERILREYQVRSDTSHFFRDDVGYCTYNIDLEYWLNEDFQQAIVMWQLEH